MRLLLLGGPRFVGRAVIEAAVARGHTLTLFNRGLTNPDLYPELERLRGDRDGGLDALGDREWDAVIDTCGYFPRIVRMSARGLQDRVGRYAFVSSISVYADVSEGVDEDSPLGTVDDETTEDLGAEHERYGPLKALCEREVQEALGERAFIVRPGLLVGPHDPTGRFTYWPHRLARGGEMLAPGPPERLVQFIDVRDLSEWLVRMVEADSSGVFNVTGAGASWGDLLDGADVTWVSDAFLVDQGVGEWMELPLWISDPAWAGMHRADVSRALAAGLSFRPLSLTVEDTLAHASLVAGVGLDPQRERTLLDAWRTQFGAVQATA
jgi:nucleoside-diphosphate-sugar epimerase